MTALAIYTFAGASVVLAGLVLSGRRIRGLWLVVWGVAPVVLVYALNPGFRVSSFHSFMHGGIVYRILNGDVPPGDPLVAGYAVHYPWGTHLVAAAISLALRITPFYALAVLNVAALAAVLVIIYRISRLLIEDRPANILSVIVACYAVTPVIPEMLRPLPATFPTEIRGIPVMHKFITVNSLPIGLVFFLLALYAAMRFYGSGIKRRHAVWLLIWTSACGFFYPAFLAGLVGGAALGYLVGLILWLRNRTGLGPARGLLPLAVVGVGAAILLPYLMSTGSGTVASMEVLRARNVWRNLVRYSVMTGPLLAVILAKRKALKWRMDRTSAVVLGVTAAAAFGVYAAIHLPLENEYKLMLLSMVTLGIFGGVAFAAVARDRSRLAAFLLLILFLIPSLRIVRLRIVRGGNTTYVESGLYVDSADREENELYVWIRDNTPTTSVFIDTELEVPVLAQRGLFVPATEPGGGGQKGYGLAGVILEVQSGYDQEMLAARKRLVRKVFNLRATLTAEEIGGLLKISPDFYVVARPGTAGGLERKSYLEKVFTSSSGTYALYRISR